MDITSLKCHILFQKWAPLSDQLAINYSGGPEIFFCVQIQFLTHTHNKTKKEQKRTRNKIIISEMFYCNLDFLI